MRPTIVRGLIMLAVLALSGLGLLSPGSDFFQDYAAARAWREGLDPNTATGLLAERYGVDGQTPTAIQVAHPPFAVLLALPFSALPWPAARVAWLLAGWLALAVAVEYGRLRPTTLAIFAPLLAFGLTLGALDALMLALLIVASRQQRRSDGLVGLALGLAVAIKLYPALLAVGLWLSGQRRAALLAGAVGAALSGAAALALGVEATLGWLAFTPLNTAHFVDHPTNIALVRYLRLLLPGLPPALCAAAVVLALIPPLRLWRRQDGIGPLAPVLVLAGPLAWGQYVPLIALGDEPPPLAAVLLACGGYSLFGSLLYLAILDAAALLPNLILVVSVVLLTAGAVATWLAAARAGEEAGATGIKGQGGTGARGAAKPRQAPPGPPTV